MSKQDAQKQFDAQAYAYRMRVRTQNTPAWRALQSFSNRKLNGKRWTEHHLGVLYLLRTPL